MILSSIILSFLYFLFNLWLLYVFLLLWDFVANFLFLFIFVCLLTFSSKVWLSEYMPEVTDMCGILLINP